MMRTIRSFEDLPSFDKAVITIGNFDGFHLGHQAILKVLSKQENIKKILITFSKNPLNILSSEKKKIGKILTNKERVEFLKSRYKIDYFLILSFTKKFSKISHEEFISSLLRKIRWISLIIGENFYFGNKKKGDVKYLQSLDPKVIEVKVIHLISSVENILSSTFIRKLIEESNMLKVKELLGYPYFISGKVISGNQIGRKIGYPTINLEIPKEKILPQEGVYKTETELENGQKYPSMTYLGKKKFGEQEKKIISLETHLLNDDFPIKEEKFSFVKVFFYEKIRGIYQFSNVEDLKEQLKKDKQVILNQNF